MDVGLVCDTCSTFNPIGVPQCSRCGAGLSLDAGRPTSRSVRAAKASGQISTATAAAAPGTRAATSPAASPAAGADAAPDAGASAPLKLPRSQSQGFAVGGSGAVAKPSIKKTQAFGLMQEARAKLVLIKGDGLDGVSFTLAGNEHLVGRSDAAMIMFEEDRYLSPVHANFFYRFGTLMVRDESSHNGVFIRIKGTVPVQFGDRFLVGEQMVQVHETPESTVPEPIDDGTYFFGSPRRPAYYRVVQILRGGLSGFSYRSDSPVTTIGREGNDIDFPDDPFISGRHARVSWKNKQLSLTDLDSKNGTFLRISGEYPLKHGDYVFMGQQLLRVEIV
jgi:pSer/pThr/pTyr-binding forkhead associated (FHA) protein